MKAPEESCQENEVDKLLSAVARMQSDTIAGLEEVNLGHTDKDHDALFTNCSGISALS